MFIGRRDCTKLVDGVLKQMKLFREVGPVPVGLSPGGLDSSSQPGGAWSAEVLGQIARGLRISAEALYVRAGILEERGDRVEVEADGSTSSIRRPATASHRGGGSARSAMRWG